MSGVGAGGRGNTSRLPYASRYPMPREWDTRQVSRLHQALQHLKVDGLTVKYTGPGTSDAQAASIRTDHPVPPDVPLYYYEVEVLNKGEDGFIGVGFATDDVDLAKLPGWAPRSYGYHGDDGNCFGGRNPGTQYGETFTTGDVIGALLDRTERTISYFKNGRPQGVAFRDVPEERLFPIIGLRTRGEEVRANFGMSAMLARGSSGAPSPAGDAEGAARDPGFRTDVRALLVGCAARVLGAVRSTPLVPPMEGGGGGDGSGTGAAAGASASAGTSSGGGSADSSAMPLLLSLVFDYMVHHRCWRTASIIAQDARGCIGMPGDEPGGKQPAGAPTAAIGTGGIAGATRGSVQDAGTLRNGSSGGSQAASGNDSSMVTAAPGSDGESRGLAAAPAAGGVLLPPERVEDMAARQRVYDAICSGDIAGALVLMSERYGSAALAKRPELSFRLKVQQFVELVRAGDDAVETALGFGRSELAPCAKTAADEDLLSDALSLLAYDRPEASPCGHLMRERQRHKLAEAVNGALLEAQGALPLAALERVYQQLSVVLDELRRGDDPRSSFIDIGTMVFDE